MRIVEEGPTGPTDATVNLWKALAAPLDPTAISWRQDGKVTKGRDDKFIARFVAYTDAQVVRERLDQVCPGEWNLTLDPLPMVTLVKAGGEVVEDDTPYAFKARLEILGVVREDVGLGRDWKSASTDAFKRAAVRFGIGHELYDMDMLWVEMQDDSKYAKPKRPPEEVYAEKLAKAAPKAQPVSGVAETAIKTLGRTPAVGAREEPMKTGTVSQIEGLRAMLLSRLMVMKSENRIGETPYTSAVDVVKNKKVTLAILHGVEERLDAMERQPQGAA